MKNGIRSRGVAFMCAVVALVGIGGIASAELKVLGKGEKMTLDATSLPDNLKPNWEIMKKKCSKCHGLDRALITVQTGITPSGAPFEKTSVKAYGVKMLKKPDSGLTGPEVKKVIELLDWMFDEASK